MIVYQESYLLKKGVLMYVVCCVLQFFIIIHNNMIFVRHTVRYVYMVLLVVSDS